MSVRAKRDTKVFTKPTLKEIQDYISEKSLSVDGKKFFDYFEAGDWTDSKGNKVKNWKQKILTWDNHSKPKEDIQQSTIPPRSMMCIGGRAI